MQLLLSFKNLPVEQDQKADGQPQKHTDVPSKGPADIDRRKQQEQQAQYAAK